MPGTECNRLNYNITSGLCLLGKGGKAVLQLYQLYLLYFLHVPILLKLFVLLQFLNFVLKVHQMDAFKVHLSIPTEPQMVYKSPVGLLLNAVELRENTTSTHSAEMSRFLGVPT